MPVTEQRRGREGRLPRRCSYLLLAASSYLLLDLACVTGQVKKENCTGLVYFHCVYIYLVCCSSTYLPAFAFVILLLYLPTVTFPVH